VDEKMAINEHMKPWAITQEELNLRFDYAEGRITSAQFKQRYKKLKKQGKVIRNGKKVKE
jgi:hypothetical protein